MISQRVYGIALGDEDANDADRLRADAMMRLPVAGIRPSGSGADSQRISDPGHSLVEEKHRVGRVQAVGHKGRQ